MVRCRAAPATILPARPAIGAQPLTRLRIGPVCLVQEVLHGRQDTEPAAKDQEAEAAEEARRLRVAVRDWID